MVVTKRWLGPALACGMTIAAVSLALSAQSPVVDMAVSQWPRSMERFEPPVPVASLEHLPVVNEAALAGALEIVRVGPGERLLLLGSRGNLRFNIYELPLAVQPGGSGFEWLEYQLTGDWWSNGGMPRAFLDEGKYVLARFGTTAPSTGGLVDARGVVGYRVQRSL